MNNPLSSKSIIEQSTAKRYGYDQKFRWTHSSITVVGWLTLNRGALDVFVHPNTGDALADHRDRALWLGRSHTLNLAALDA